MPDPFNTDRNRLPEPHRDFSGPANNDGFGKRAFKAIAKLWQPRGTTAEEAAATVARYAMRLIDRSSGKAYSADEVALAAIDLIDTAEKRAAVRGALQVRSLVAPFWKPLKRISAYQDSGKPIVVRSVVLGDSWGISCTPNLNATFGNYGQIVGPTYSDKTNTFSGNVKSTPFFEKYGKTPFEGRSIELTGAGNVIWGEGNGARRFSASGPVIAVMYERVSGGGTISVQYETSTDGTFTDVGVVGIWRAASGSGSLPVASQINTGSGAGASEFAIALFEMPAACTARVRCTWVSGTANVYAVGVVGSTDLEPSTGTTRQGHVECMLNIGSLRLSYYNQVPQSVWNTLFGWLKPDLVWVREKTEVSAPEWGAEFDALMATLVTGYSQSTVICIGSNPTQLTESLDQAVDAHMQKWCEATNNLYIPLRSYFPDYATYVANGMGDIVHMSELSARYAIKVMWDYLTPFHHFAVDGGQNNAASGGIRPLGDGVDMKKFFATFTSNVPGETASIGIRDKGRGTFNMLPAYEVRALGKTSTAFADGVQIFAANAVPYVHTDSIGRSMYGPVATPTRTPGSATGIGNGAHYEFFGNNTGLVTLSLQVQSGQAQNILEVRTGATTAAGGTLVSGYRSHGRPFATLPTYADNAAALAGSLVAGDFYRTSTGVLMVVY